MAAAPSYRMISIGEAPTVAIGGGELDWVPVRRQLGVGAFGVNAYRAASAGDQVIEDHVESPGQEELYVVLAGRMTLTVGEEEVDCRRGAAAFLPDPTVRRSGKATEDGTIVLAVGGWRDRPYHPLPWEPIYLAAEPMARGDWAAAVAILENEADEHRESPFVRYRLGCCLAQAGEHDAAMREITAALEANPALRERTASDELLSPLRDRDDWPLRDPLSG